MVMVNLRTKLILSIAFFGLVSASLQAAAADDRTSVDKARAHFEHGERLYKVSRYREALEEFKEGFVAKADPVFLFNIAQCHRLLGEREDALTFYRRYLQADPRSFRRVEIEKRIHDLEAQLAADPTPRTVPPPVAAAPPPSPSPPPPSTPAVSSLAPVNTTSPAAMPLVITTKSDEPAPTGRPLYRRWWVWTGLGVVAAVVATTLILRGSGDGPCGTSVAACEKL
jgi:tetratricopeptide (TPR) repeat protein